MPIQIPASITDPNKRYDFIVLYDCKDGNPNGDPDAGNMPRTDPETMQGLVTDVCLKRKIRNYVDLVHTQNSINDDPSCDPAVLDNGIYVRDSGVRLNTKNKAALQDVGAIAPDASVVALEDDGNTDDPIVDDDTDDDAKAGKAKKPGKKDVKKGLSTKVSDAGQAKMCQRYWDVRMFGGVLTPGKFVDKAGTAYVTCGQVRGPMQLTFGRSVDPIVPVDYTITRCAITKVEDVKEGEMGRKAQIAYGLYVSKGFYSPLLAQNTGVSAQDLELFWQALVSMFENDRSAARGEMEVCGVFIFAHENQLGNAASGRLFQRLHITRKDESKPARSIDDYDVVVDEDKLPSGVTLTIL